MNFFFERTLNKSFDCTFLNSSKPKRCFLSRVILSFQELLLIDSNLNKFFLKRYQRKKSQRLEKCCILNKSLFAISKLSKHSRKISQQILPLAFINCSNTCQNSINARAPQQFLKNV